MSKSEFPAKTFTIEKSITLKLGEDYFRSAFGLIVDLSTGASLEDVKKHAENLIDRWLDEEKHLLQTSKEVSSIPQIDIEELGHCEWLTYQKAPAKPDEAAWIKNPVQFSDWKNPPNVLLILVKALEKSKDRKLVLGNMEYGVSGKDDMKDHFISRRSMKKEGAK